ncbi:hypothetical protein ACHAPU_002355 [Fusarium lateritium]
MSLPHQPTAYPIFLFTTPLQNQKKLFKKPLDVIGHWAVCINGVCYELTRASKDEKKKNKLKGNHWIRTLSLDQWKDIKKSETRAVSEPKLVGYTTQPFSHDTIHYIAILIWQTSLQEKYVYDENNCQVFIRLLVELVGNAEVKAKFPTFFSEEVKKAGIARDSTALIATAGMATVAAGTSLMFAPVDPSGASAAGFFIAASTALRSTTALWSARINKEEFIKSAQAELRQRLINERVLFL